MRYKLKCCFTSTKTVGLLWTGAQDGHLDFHTAPELCAVISRMCSVLLLFVVVFFSFFLFFFFFCSVFLQSYGHDLLTYV